jgi:hypothetical protein
MTADPLAARAWQEAQLMINRPAPEPDQEIKMTAQILRTDEWVPPADFVSTARKAARELGLDTPLTGSRHDRDRLDAAWQLLSGKAGISVSRLREAGERRTGLDAGDSFPTSLSEASAVVSLAADFETGDASVLALAAGEDDDGLALDFSAVDAGLEVQRIAMAYGESGLPGMPRMDVHKAMQQVADTGRPAPSTRPAYVTPDPQQAMEIDLLAHLSLTGVPAPEEGARQRAGLAGEDYTPDSAPTDGLQLTADAATDEIGRYTVMLASQRRDGPNLDKFGSPRRGQKKRADREDELGEDPTDYDQDPSGGHEEVQRIIRANPHLFSNEHGRVPLLSSLGSPSNRNGTA